jgi:hypothetical protein
MVYSFSHHPVPSPSGSFLIVTGRNYCHSRRSIIKTYLLLSEDDNDDLSKTFISALQAPWRNQIKYSNL